jgi:L-rhamnose-H+ transport protein
MPTREQLAGALVVFGAGLIAGFFTSPMLLVKGWEWENTWAVYSFFGMVFFPWLTVFAVVPDAAGVFSDVATSTPGSIIKNCIFGAVWGVGSVLFGLGTDAVGNALGFALILGLTSAMGSAIPLLVLNPEEATERVGIFTWIGLVIVIIGLTLLATAGSRRDKEQAAAKTGEASPLMINSMEEAPAEKGGACYAYFSLIAIALLRIMDHPLA